MAEINYVGTNQSLRKSIVYYILVFALVALALSFATADLCNRAIKAITDSYPPTYEKYYLTNEKGERLGEGTYIGDVTVPTSKQDEKCISFLQLVPICATPVYSVACIMAAAFLFYRNKLKKPLAELMAASEKISENNLDFSIEYDSRDELGQLCNSFEIMRSTLAHNISEMWRHVEDRKQLNAAFAHDLRTPLTVLKGYNEMIQSGSDIETCRTAETMGRHIERLEHYIDSMSKMCRLKDSKPEYIPTSLPALISSLSAEANTLCDKGSIRFTVKNETVSDVICVDPLFISQVINNLISNAIRYAKSSITLCISEVKDGLLLSVLDDGGGFSKRSLQRAAAPYFSEAENHLEHFGLGLYICKVLSENHGGYLSIENVDCGAKVSVFFKKS